MCVLLSQSVVSDKLDYIWTSGRLCDFKGCDRADLQPVSVNGWFWTGSNKKIPPTNSTPPDWSYQVILQLSLPIYLGS